jgi:serine/threonine protein kinase
MNKAYSNKALPMGTVLREWRIEEVLGVGGFGIVYKAKGIYFNELVAIKEYFPSAISERNSEETVVPIDSDAEEVHALGLKKFVEEAKLLWNLSTPTRHPNIVSVRSLFEIHGTAYMVMDFEDGISLSKMLKQGRRFNERALWNILQPIAEGLDRAHRVGVLHRDIKPPNILINEDNRPVLIDFGSARFDTAEATSTKVTFHTPPYAAIEQYVKTYPQGPWTDIYALGVVMYECITGEKPPEVLERLHAGLGKPLEEGKWPGYSKRFLHSIDAAMIVKPDERPQSISEWLPMFGRDYGEDAGDGDEATRFYAKQVQAEDIVPVPPTPTDKAKVETAVPKDRKEARFKRAGEETGASKKIASEKEAAEAEGKAGVAALASADAAAVAEKGPSKAGKAQPPKEGAKKLNPLVMGGAAAALLVAVGGGALMMRGGSTKPELTQSNAALPAIDNSPATVAALGGPDAANQAVPVGDETGNIGSPVAVPPPTAQPNPLQALQAEKAKTAAAEAKLAAIKKAQAKAALAQAVPGAPIPPKGKAGKGANGAMQAASSEAESGSVSPAKMAQFNAAIDDARGLARQVMRNGTGQNVQTAKNYDKYLKTLKASMGGIHSDKEADRLIKQAYQTRAYIQSLMH